MKKFKSTKEVYETYFPSLRLDQSELLRREIHDDYEIEHKAKKLSESIVKDFFNRDKVLEIDDEHSEEESTDSHSEQTLTADKTVETVMNRKRGLFRYRR